MTGNATPRPDSFGTVLRTHRAATNLTQEELAARSGLTAQAVSLLERGARSRPRTDTVERLADALRLSAAQRTAFVAAGRGLADAYVVKSPRSAGRSLGRREGGAVAVVMLLTLIVASLGWW